MIIELTTSNIVWILIGAGLALTAISIGILGLWFFRPLLKKRFLCSVEERRVINMIMQDKKDGKYVIYYTLEDLKRLADEMIDLVGEKLMAGDGITKMDIQNIIMDIDDNHEA